MKSSVDIGSLKIRYRSNEERDVDLLVYNLSDWIGVILKFEGLLNWESPLLLFSTVLSISTIFLLFYIYHPAVLVTVGFFGLLLSIMDYFGPFVSARIIPKLPPSEADERYREFCRRLVHARYMLTNLFTFLRGLRVDHPIIYLFTTIPLLAIGGFIGLQVNNLLLLYILLITCLLTPGIRHNGIFGIVTYPIKRLISGCPTRLTKSVLNFCVFTIKWIFTQIRSLCSRNRANKND